MSGLTAKQMEVIHTHGSGEFENDLEKVMATVCDDPYYELPSLGVALKGREAVREFYRLTLPPMVDRDVVGEIRVEAGTDTTLLSENIVHLTADGVRHHCRVAAVITMVGDLFQGERIYADPVFTDLWKRDLGPDFMSFPGVVPLA